MDMKTLSSAEIGKKLVVDKLLPSELHSKLLEMGLYEGKEISIIYKAPLGDPIAVQVGDYVLSMRLQEASLILVNEN